MDKDAFEAAMKAFDEVMGSIEDESACLREPDAVSAAIDAYLKTAFPQLLDAFKKATSVIEELMP